MFVVNINGHIVAQNPTKLEINEIAEVSDLYDPTSESYIIEDKLMCRCAIDVDTKTVYAWTGLPLHNEIAGYLDGHEVALGFFVFSESGDLEFLEFTEEYGRPELPNKSARLILKQRYKTVKFREDSPQVSSSISVSPENSSGRRAGKRVKNKKPIVPVITIGGSKVNEHYQKFFKEESNPRKQYYAKSKFFTSRPVSSVKTALKYALDVDEDSSQFEVYDANTDKLIHTYTREQAIEVIQT